MKLFWTMSQKMQNVPSPWELLNSIFEWVWSTTTTPNISFHYEVEGRIILPISNLFSLHFSLPSFHWPATENVSLSCEQECPLHNTGTLGSILWTVSLTVQNPSITKGVINIKFECEQFFPHYLCDHQLNFCFFKQKPHVLHDKIQENESSLEVKMHAIGDNSNILIYINASYTSLIDKSYGILLEILFKG